MSKFFEVTISSHLTMVVEMEDDASDDDAQHCALMEADYNFNGQPEVICSYEITDRQAIETCIRHADQVERL